MKEKEDKLFFANDVSWQYFKTFFSSSPMMLRQNKLEHLSLKRRNPVNVR